VSGGSSTEGIYSGSTSEPSPVRVLELEDSALCSAMAGFTAKDVLASRPIPMSLVAEEDLRRLHCALRRGYPGSEKCP